MDAIEKIIEDAEQLYTKLRVNQLQQALVASDMSEEAFKALLLDMAENENVLTVHADKGTN